MKAEIEKNLKFCDEIREKLKKLKKSKATRADIYFLVDELITKTKWLKQLYKQIID